MGQIRIAISLSLTQIFIYFDLRIFTVQTYLETAGVEPAQYHISKPATG
jgi:hypothetical protein